MNSILKLPKVSEPFVEHLEGRQLDKNEWMPCPRCGQASVEPPSGALAGGCAGASMIGCWIVLVIIGCAILAVVFYPAAIVAGVVGLVMIPFLPAMGAAMGAMYKCKSCDFSWTFKDVQDYKRRREAQTS